MPILRCYKIINSTSVTEVSRTVLKSNFDFSGTFYWYVEVQSIHDFNLNVWYEVLPKNILYLLKNKKMTLLVSTNFEGFLSVVEPIYQLLILQLEIPEEQLMLFTGARDIVPTVNSVAKKYNKNEITVVWAVPHEKHIRVFENEKNTNPGFIQTYKFYKKFICLNRRWRAHRLAFVSLLIINKIVDKGYVSLIESEFQDSVWIKKWDLLLDKNPKFKDLFLQHKNVILNSTPMVVDLPTLDDSACIFNNINMDGIYNNSYFSIVTETNYYSGDGRFLTEKSFKPIVNYHPFIMLAPPNSLDALRERGYRTFHPFINEDYDSIVDDEKRMNMVLEETKRLCNLTESELKTFIDGCREICIYNYNNLFHGMKPYLQLN